MRKTLIFEGSINSETAPTILNFINQNEGDLLVGINSGGGETVVGKLLLRAMNDNKDRVELMCLSGVYSSAFYLFYNYEGARSLTVGCKGMWHLGRLDISYSYQLKPYFRDGKSDLDTLAEEGKHSLDFAQKFMTAKELKDYNKNKDVYFKFSRMKELFPDAKIY